jgi:Mg-chelatase subunit ChlD/pimeloyl-ACP methyl ester carboxylesterase
MHMNWKTRILLGLMLLSVCWMGLPLEASPRGLTASVSSSTAQVTKVHPVILVHGLGSTAERWYETGTIYYTLQADGYDMDYVWAFAYPPGPGQEDSYGDIRLIAQRLADEVSRLSQASQQANGPDKVDVVVHSLGGLITRQYLSQHKLDHNIDKFIDIGTPHQGSELMRTYNDGMDGLADYVSDGQVSSWLVREVIDLFVHAGWELADLNRLVPDPTTPAAQQLDPEGSFIKELNHPGQSPEDVDYSMIYGDITVGLEMDVFGIPVMSEEYFSVGDLAVSRNNASTIPELGSREGPNPDYYHAYGFSAPVLLPISLDLWSPSIRILDLQDRIAQAADVSHINLVRNSEVNQRILAILNEDFVPPTVEPAPGGAETATVFVLDVSGSMEDPWRGGSKIESAKQAALSVLNMIEQESQVGGVSHQVAVATFSTDAWLNLPLTTDYPEVRRAIQALQPLNRTNLGAGLQQANRALQSAADATKIEILLSDGLTNEGMSRDQILSGPVQEAAQAGTCIYTVGFGDPGDLDEDLLGRIAQAACGQYSYAETPYDLERVYVQVRHESLGDIIDQFSGQVAQGDTTPPRSVEVPRSQQEMHATLNWPGSRLDMILTDPRGRKVDVNYPGVTIATYARMAYMIITDPLPGLWQVAIEGVDVPEGIIDYSAILSVRPRIGPGASDNATWLLILLLMVLIGGGVAAVVLHTQRRPARGPAAVARSAGVRVDGEPGRWAGFRRGVLQIGREPSSELVLSDPQVSRIHARILQTSQGYVIEDLNSTNGTFVNGQRITTQYLRPGDRIQVGDTHLLFWIGGSQ